MKQGVWINRDFDKASKIYEEFTYKVERENRFLTMLHLAVSEIRKYEEKAKGESSKLDEARKASEAYRTNLIGYMLT